MGIGDCIGGVKEKVRVVERIYLGGGKCMGDGSGAADRLLGLEGWGKGLG